ncbi:MAG: hypothetical protein N838_32105 [Thiohalocapsa sp. PB-PSB1]|nr:MAG: hypothetical protein N838_32105 [Thiohalocapsa sp. PB-PSB1]
MPALLKMPAAAQMELLAVNISMVFIGDLYW